MSVSVAEFDELVRAAFEELPEVYRDACDGLGIRTEPHAADDVLQSLEIADPSELLGLYHGVNLARKSVFDLAGLPDEVIIYRNPIIAYARATGQPLADVVRHVLVHEIGHHFGFSDDDMEAIENRDA
jgi:predicted Zn-dependent protease with MMP-like domain